MLVAVGTLIDRKRHTLSEKGSMVLAGHTHFLLGIAQTHHTTSSILMQDSHTKLCGKVLCWCMHVYMHTPAEYMYTYMYVSLQGWVRNAPEPLVLNFPTIIHASLILRSSVSNEEI